MEEKKKMYSRSEVFEIMRSRGWYEVICKGEPIAGRFWKDEDATGELYELDSHPDGPSRVVSSSGEVVRFGTFGDTWYWK